LTPPQFKKDQRVLLDNPMKGKLSLRWSGPWTVEGMKNATTVVLRMGLLVIQFMLTISGIYWKKMCAIRLGSTIALK